MFEIIQLEDGRYAILNKYTGYALPGKDEAVKSFRSVKKADKYLDKLSRRLASTIDKLSKKSNLS